MDEQPRRFGRRAPAGQLVVVHGRAGDAEVLSLIGQLDISSVGRLVSEAADAVRHGHPRLILDLAGVEFVDSAGLAGLLNVLRRTGKAGGGLVLVHVQPVVSELLSLTRLDRELEFAATLPQAEAKLAALRA